MNEMYKTMLETKKNELIALGEHIESLYNLVYKTQDQIEDAEEKQTLIEKEVAELTMRVKAGDLGEYGYSLLSLQGKKDEKQNLEGYFMCKDKFIICNGSLIVMLNEKPPLLEENKDFSMNEELCHSQFAIKPIETIKGKAIGEYENETDTIWKDSLLYSKKPPYEVLKIGSAHIQKKFAEAVWQVLGVDEKAIIQTYNTTSRRAKDIEARNIHVMTGNGEAIILGLKKKV